MDNGSPYDSEYTSKISNDDYHPYDELSCDKKTKSDDSGSISLIIGIAAVALSFYLSIVALPLGIIAIILGSKIMNTSKIGTAGFVLGIIACIISPISILLFLI